MTDQKRNVNGKPLLKIILLTACLSLIVAGTAGYFFGRSKGPEEPGRVAATGESVEEDILWTCGMHPWILSEEPGLCPICNMELTPKEKEGEAAAGEDEERTILYWRAPMDPTEIYTEPGKSKMGMDLVPVYEDEVVGGVDIKIDPVTRQNMGLRTAPVERGELVNTIRTYGHITYDETSTTVISPKFSGWIDRVYVDFTGQQVEKGEKLFEIYSPELFTAQEEYLVAYRSLQHLEGTETKGLLESARQRLLNWDVPASEIREIEQTMRVKKNLTIRSPFTGVVTMYKAREGTYAKPGDPLYQISDLSTVWVEAHIYEYELPWVEKGQEAVMTLPYLPGKRFTGTVAYVYPYLQKETRDVVVRLEFANPDYVLKPEMYADVKILVGSRGEGLIIPSEAVIRSGERNLVFVDRGNGKFSPREVRLGLSLEGGRVQVLEGLAPNERIVTSGQFLLDSESKLKEAVQKMIEAKKPAAETEPQAPAESGGDDFFEDLEQERAEDDFFSDM